MKFRPALAVFGLYVLAHGAIANAADAVGDAKQGAVLFYTCHGCHGVPDYKNAYPNYSVPNLGGQHAKYIVAALNEYASGDRPHQTMHAQAVTLSDQDRLDIAAYLQSTPVPPRNEVVGTPPPATQTCVACHGADGAKTATEDYPVLAGQYEDYLLQALKDYKAGRRKNPIMASIVAGVKEEDFPALAHYFSQQRGLCSTQDLRTHGKCLEH
ncbi:MAG TPA: c-type cytochrome [Steroidobacteraceae bacterium]|jgi:cytochrome c553|nr:c-type cytochrome [Steroidobacteraceae bacterium]